VSKRWKRLSHEIEVLKLRFRKNPYRAPFPDLKVEQNVAPVGNSFGDGRTPHKTQPAGAKQFATGTTHKQGPMLLTDGMIKNEMQFIGGKKV